MSAFTLAWRTVTAERSRAALAVAGVTVIGALLFDMLLLSRGLLVSFRQMLDAAGFDVRVVASDALPVTGAIPHATDLAHDLRRLPEIRAVSVVRTERAAVLVSDRRPVEATLLNVTPGREQQAWRMVRGHDLDSSGAQASGRYPSLLSHRLAESLALNVGGSLTIRVKESGVASALPPVTLDVVGVAEFEFAGNDEHIVATTFDAFQRARASNDDTADMVVVASRPGVESAETVAAIARARPDVHAYSNAQMVTRIDENGFAYFRQISLVLSSITLGFAFLLVATLLTVSVNQRLGHVAALRALGLPRRRIAQMLAWESALLIGVGGALSLPVGWLLALQLDRILRQMPGLPERIHFFVFEPRIALWHVTLLAATGAIAAIYPVWIATRLPIAATLRLETVS